MCDAFVGRFRGGALLGAVVVPSTGAVMVVVVGTGAALRSGPAAGQSAKSSPLLARALGAPKACRTV